MANVLVIRLSAIGDVAMTIPVLYSVARENPEDTFTLLTQPFLQLLLINPPPNVTVRPIDTKGTEKSFLGLMKFARQLSKEPYDIVIDLHAVIRSKLIASWFKMKGRKVYVLDKMREARKKLVRKDHKVLRPIRQTTDRYADVFIKAGFDYKEQFDSLYESSLPDMSFITETYGEKNTERWIGIAPFAKHKGKIYPLEEMEKVVKLLSEREGTKVFLFGGKGEEQKVLDSWQERYKEVFSIVGKFSLDKELVLIDHLDLLISMDSANMHFASLVQTPVVSIWGATHPYAGFYGYKQDPENCIQAPLLCRPCSVFGQKECYRGDWACLSWITPDMIIDKIDLHFQ